MITCLTCLKDIEKPLRREIKVDGDDFPQCDDCYSKELEEDDK